MGAPEFSQKVVRYLKISSLLGLGVYGAISGCKEETREQPAPARTNPPYQYPSPNYFQPQASPAAAAPACDPNEYVCYPDAKVVEECKKTQSDVSLCEGKIQKALYKQLSDKVGMGGNTTCTDAYVYTVDAGPAGDLNIRKGPSTTSEILSTASRGTKLCYIKNEDEGDWGKIRYNNGPAYVARNYIADKKPGVVASGSAGTGGGGTGGGGTGAGLPNGGITCPSGYFASKVRANLYVDPPKYYAAAAHDQKSPAGFLIDGQFVCGSNITQTVKGGNPWDLPYMVVKVRVPNKGSTDYWISCKHFYDAFAAKSGCP